ncbi:MAG TPA: sugar ABC transporter substrate-binding protein [Chthonomonadaceae bacterium]|nr:sugar ABC transporter substrate-binding protein [Chthonomonadaceae bacterium]
MFVPSNPFSIIPTGRGLRWSILLFCTLLAGCAASRPVADAPPLTADALSRPGQVEGHIEVWSWNIAAKALQQLTPTFRRQYPRIDPNVDMTGANMQARLLLSLASNVGAPDVMQLQCEEAPHYLCTGKLADLTAVAAGFQKDFPASLWHNCVYKGRVYAIPWDMGPCAIYYKRNIFQQYGIDPDKIETWDDFIAAGQEILQKSHGQTKMLPMDTGALATMYQLLIQQNGGQVFDDNGRIAVNSPQSRQALGVLRRMLQAGICSNVKMWGQEFMAGLNNDTIATYPEAAWFAGTIKDAAPDYGGKRQIWGIFRLPALVKGGLRTSNLGGSVLVIPQQCRNKPAAWAFLRYALCTAEGQLAMYRSENLFPAYLPALRSPVFDEPDPFFGGQQIGRLFAGDAAKMNILNRTADWMEALGYLNQTFSKWADEGMTDTEALAELEQKLHRRLGVEIAPSSPSRTAHRTRARQSHDEA